MIPYSRPLRSVLLALLVVLGACDRPAAEPDGRVERPAFDSARAYAFLERQVAFGPRVPGTPGHAAQLAWMDSLLRAHADTVIAQRFTHTTTSGETLELTNLLARFDPGAKERILLLAHWDTRPHADQSPDPAARDLPVPGANDGASGTAVLLELAILLSRSPPPVGVDLLLVDGEDYGPTGEDMYLGARHFAQNQPAGYPPLYGVLLDMVGDRDLRLPMEQYSLQYAPEVVQRVWGVARDLGYADVFVNEPGPAILDDHIPLNEGGIRTIDVIDFEYGPGHAYWHTPLDVPRNTSAGSLGIVGDVMAELVYRGG